MTQTQKSIRRLWFCAFGCTEVFEWRCSSYH